ncbi:hypothetical protein [Cupriavidus sp. YAF13]|uniref:hypothetical protein n=1 Tax=Cupriavidus sp. YAF13 TaxID=3233075 RepID=UPI003F928CDB
MGKIRNGYVKKAASQVGNMIATWKCIGGIDADPAAARDCLIMPERRNGALAGPCSP